jgi:hypothetical protein
VSGGYVAQMGELINLVSPWSRILLDRLTVTWPVQKFQHFMETESTQFPIPSQVHSAHTFPFYFSKVKVKVKGKVVPVL